MSSVELAQGLEEKMRRINQRKEKYKRSTNNSHKKFICVARKLLFKLCTYRERELFQKEFEPFQNSRVYYFVILAHVKIRMTASQRDNFQRNLTTLLNAKVHTYNEEIKRTNNKNFINFRFEEIADIQFALKALILYLDNKVEEAIEVIYKKEKGFVLKKQQFEMAINTVAELEDRLRAYPEGELFPYLNERPKKIEMVKQKSSGGGRRGKQEEDEEWVQQKNYRESSRHVWKREKRKDISSHCKNQHGATKTPLLFLEDSFPINPHFYSVLFSYPDPQPTHHYPSGPFKQSNFDQYNLNCLKMQPNYDYNGFTTSQINYSHQSCLKTFHQYTIMNQYPQKNTQFNEKNNLFFNYTNNKKQLRPPRQTQDTIKKVQPGMSDSYES